MCKEIKIEETKWEELEELREYEPIGVYSERQALESYEEYKREQENY